METTVTELPSDNECIHKSVLRRESEGFVAFNKSLEECQTTPDASNPVKKDTTKTGKVNLSPMTPLKGIGGQSVQVLKIDDLRMFCSRNDIKGIRKAKKADICWAICKAKEAYLAGQPAPYKDLMPASDGTEVDDNGSVAVLPVSVQHELAVAEVWGGWCQFW